jgi:hypothetical protein
MGVWSPTAATDLHVSTDTWVVSTGTRVVAIGCPWGLTRPIIAVGFKQVIDLE